jgi:transcriptional antiterminator RfaH
MLRRAGQNGDRWYVIQTKPCKEHLVERLLQTRGIQTYLPLLQAGKARHRAGRLDRPFFSSYLFACMDLGRVALSSINWAPGVARVVSFGGKPAQVPDRVIQRLQDRLASVDGKAYFGGLPLRPGDRLRVTKGPLRDMEAIFDQRLSSEDRARVFIELLGRLTACQIELRCLRRVES